ncbi:hypothetical protein [Mycolicibacterium sediminis]|uniref:Uncharacterized protein n=1 Tax=Mycolicibacterium sediminis TaxID=1286180 RepID=A0A7I7QLG2_9MYCO|nr:hypothetical protein [Mycolicibacterium sediminis]BBY27125.1 hypothetical protein MSEDJ_12210 [Mycolicibacterium sediminis]
MDWRTTTSQTAQADLDDLLKDSIQVAVQGLGDQSLVPFMLVITHSGERAVRSLAARLPNAAVDSAIAALQGDRDSEDLRARATVLDVSVREPFAGDAINVRLEHQEGPSIDILVPYRSTPAGITVSTDALTAAADTRRLWPAPST